MGGAHPLYETSMTGWRSNHAPAMLRANTRSKKKKSRRSNWRTREDEKKWERGGKEEIRKGGRRFKKGKRCSRASRRKSTSDERSRWKFFSSRELLFAEFPLFFFPSLFPPFLPSLLRPNCIHRWERDRATTTRLNENWPRLSTGDQPGE